MSAPSGAGSEDRLDSWKEIAAYLGREVRTVQGWEKSEGLPVHRHQHARQGTVYAFKSELDAWRGARRGTPEPPASPPPSARSFPWRIAIAAGALLFLVAGATLLWTRSRGAPGGDIPTSIVVLPFLDLSPEKDQEYFADGLTEELIDALTRMPNLKVVARTSAFAFKGKPADIRRIGEQLNVAAVLEGSVRKSGDQLRITAQLARVSDGYHLWSHTYDRRLSDVFAVQRELSNAIAGELRAGEAPHRERPRDLEAWRLYLQGRYFFNKFELPDSDLKAIAQFEQAVARDPNFAQAYAGMADAWAYLAENFISPPKEVMPKARAAAEKALALDDSSPEAHVSYGIVKLDFDRDRDAGQREFLRAMQLNPGSGYARHWYAHSLEAQGRLDDAMREMRAALDLDPLSVPINWDVGSELMAKGRYDEALQQLQKAADLFPGVPLFRYLSILTCRLKGDAESARSLAADLRTRHPELLEDPLFLPLFGAEAARDGRVEEARQTLRRLEQLRQTRYVDAFLALPLTTALHDRAETLRWLKRAAEERSSMFVYLVAGLRTIYGIDDELMAQVGGS
jgi:TolB-like protein/Tfp pilus assembly protein PilF